MNPHIKKTTFFEKRKKNRLKTTKTMYKIYQIVGKKELMLKGEKKYGREQTEDR